MSGMNVTVGIKNAAFKQGLDEMRRGAAEFKGSLKDMFLGVAGPVALATTAVLTFKRAIDKASEMEGFETTFKTLLGSAKAAKDRMKELADFAASTPFELPEIAKASKVLESLTKGALSTGEGLTLVGDAAAGVNVPFGELAVTVGRVYAGIQAGSQTIGAEMNRLMELGLLSAETKIQINALMAEGKKGSEVWALLAAELGQYSGNMKEMSNTFAGKMSTLSDTWDELLRTFAKPLMPNLKNEVGQATSLLESLRLGADILGRSLQGFFGYIATGLDITISGFREAYEFLMTFFRFAGTGFTAMGQSIEAVKSGDFAGVAKAWGEAGKKAFGDMEKAAISFYKRVDEAKARITGRFASESEPTDEGDGTGAKKPTPQDPADAQAEKDAQKREDRIKKIADAEKDAARDKLEGEAKINALIEERARLMDIYNADKEGDAGLDALEEAQKIQRQIEAEQERQDKERIRREKDIADAREEERQAEEDYRFGKLSDEDKIKALEQQKADKLAEAARLEETDPAAAAKARTDAIGIQEDIDSRKADLADKAAQKEKEAADAKAKKAGELQKKLEEGQAKIDDLEKQKGDARKNAAASIRVSSIQAVGGGGGSSRGGDPTARLAEQQLTVSRQMLEVLRELRSQGIPMPEKVTPSTSWQ